MADTAGRKRNRINAPGNKIALQVHSTRQCMHIALDPRIVTLTAGGHIQGYTSI
jgi:hypothetical protein